MPDRLAVLGGKKSCNVPPHPWPVFDRKEQDAVGAVVNSGKWGRLDGPEVARFETRFAEYQQAKYAIAVVNGSVSLRLSLMAAGIQAGDEVIVPPYTFLTTATSVVEANAVPVFADIDPETFNICPRAIEKAITPRTKAIIPVHFAGLPRNLFAQALAAEGVLASLGYLLPLHRQPLFLDKAFGPYVGYKITNPDLDYAKTSCPVCEKICDSQAMWLPQNVFLGTAAEMDSIAWAFEKLYNNRSQLIEYGRQVQKKT